MTNLIIRKLRLWAFKRTKLNEVEILTVDNELVSDISVAISRPQFHLSLLGSLASLRTYRHLAAKMGTTKGGGKQWQTTPKYFPRMQCARAIPVT
jgi:hypothetical protein